MATAIRMIGHEDRLSLVDHLDELRSRLIVSVLAFAIAFGVCFWQNQALLKIVNAPLEHQTKQQVEKGDGPMGKVWETEKAVRAVSKDTAGIAQALSKSSSGLPAATRSALSSQIAKLNADAATLPASADGYNPTTIGFGEPFTTTLTVTLYFALLISLPVLLFELYAFVLPAFKPAERSVAMPLMLAVPFLFAAGVTFGYYVVLPAAVHFFQNFNASNFNVLVQASSYYKFAITVLIAMGLIFQVPVAILGITHAGVVTPKQLRKGRRYAILVCALIAAFLPGDAVTLVLETVPLYVLFEASVLLAAIVERRRTRRGRAAAAAGVGGPAAAWAAAGGAEGGAEGGATGGATGGGERSEGAAIDPEVQDMLDHIDPDLHG